jgi:hypothetical protein
MKVAGLQQVGAFFRREEEAVSTKAKSVIGTVEADAGKIRDDVYDFAGQTIGRLEVAGINFPQAHYIKDVTPGVLSRGSRVDFLAGDNMRTPKADIPSLPHSVADLSARGFKSIVDLRLEGRGDQVPAGSSMQVHRIPILDNAHPSNAQVVDFLSWVSAPAHQPCYVHCEAGVGRTGIIVASYLMAIATNPATGKHYTLDEALAETQKDGRKMLPNQIAFLKSFDADLRAGRVPGYPTK